jgi:hypothetical protein
MLMFLVLGSWIGLSTGPGLARSLGLPFELGVVIASLVGFVALSGLFFGLVKAITLRAQSRLRRPSVLARVARRVVNEPAHELKDGRLTAWWTGSPELGPVLQEQKARTDRLMERLLGASDAAERPLQVLGFARRIDYVGFHRRLSLITSTVDGIYLPGQNPTAVFTTEPAPGKPPSKNVILGQLFVYHHVNGPKGLIGPMWFVQGLPLSASRLTAPGGTWRLNRAMLASIRGGTALDAEDLFGFTAIQLGHVVRDLKDRASYTRFVQLRSQSCSLIDYLGGETAPAPRREGLRSFVADLRAGRSPLEALELRLGATPQTLVNQWRGWVEQRGVGPHTAPEPESRATLDHILELVRDRHADPEARIGAIREAGVSGYAYGAWDLIDCLCDPDEDPELKPELAWALATISGQGPTSDPASWWTWLDTVPADARGG